MNTSYSLDAYRSHDLNIMMKTSSGDVINMDFANKQELSINHKESNGSTQSSLSFASMQSFQFSMTGNGIDKQDQKEIKEFMKIAQPFIDNFMKELDQGTPVSPLNKIAKEIADIFAPLKEKGRDTQALTKNYIVEMFDNAINEMKDITNIENIFKESEKLLEKTLREFDDFNKFIYA